MVQKQAQIFRKVPDIFGDCQSSKYFVSPCSDSLYSKKIARMPFVQLVACIRSMFSVWRRCARWCLPHKKQPSIHAYKAIVDGEIILSSRISCDLHTFHFARSNKTDSHILPGPCHISFLEYITRYGLLKVPLLKYIDFIQLQRSMAYLVAYMQLRSPSAEPLQVCGPTTTLR